jgi:hypothetical protein
MVGKPAERLVDVEAFMPQYRTYHDRFDQKWRFDEVAKVSEEARPFVWVSIIDSGDVLVQANLIQMGKTVSAGLRHRQEFTPQSTHFPQGDVGQLPFLKHLKK